MSVRLRMVSGLVVSVAIVLAAFAGAFVAQRAFATTQGVIYACVGERSGALRVVDGPDDCLRGEEPLSWDSQPSSGIAGYERLTAGPFTAIPGARFVRTVTCPSGKVAIGGGVELASGNLDDLRVVESFPSTDLSWTTVTFHEGGAPSMNLVFYAVCANASS